jgi:hypothetical protein
MADPIFNRAAELDSPAWDAAAVTPADANLPRFPTTGLYVGTVGDVAVKMSGGTTVTFAAVPAGTTLAIRVDQVLATGTATGALRTGIVALYHS